MTGTEGHPGTCAGNRGQPSVTGIEGALGRNKAGGTCRGETVEVLTCWAQKLGFRVEEWFVRGELGKQLTVVSDTAQCKGLEGTLRAGRTLGQRPDLNREMRDGKEQEWAKMEKMQEEEPTGLTRSRKQSRGRKGTDV